MKKRVLRLAALCLTLLLFCTSLCGCDAIDELRTAKAVQPDERTIVWNGATYKRLDALKSQKIEVGGMDDTRSLYVGAEDVPVLLLTLFGTELHPTENNVFLCPAYYMEWDSISPYGGEAGGYYYCREDRFEDVARQLRDGPDLTGYMYEYYDYEEEKFYIYHFSKEEAAAFEKVLTPAYRWGSGVYDYDYSTPIAACSDDVLIDTTKTYNILKDGSAYYVEYYPEVTDGDVWWAQEEAEYYRVPQELYGVFERMLKKSMEELTYWEDMDIEMTESVFFVPDEEAQGEVV